MATNPMQRKAKNSFLLGFLLMLLIASIIVGILLLQLIKQNKQIKDTEAAKKDVYVLNKDVQSGTPMTSDMFTKVKAESNAMPLSSVKPGDLDETSVARINLSKGQILTENMIATADSLEGNDIRFQEYTSIVMPSQIETGEYIDIRLRMPNGTDYIVVSKKRIEIPEVAGVPSATTMVMEMNESETLLLSNAIVEAYIVDGSLLYATRYTEAGNQEAAKISYLPNADVTRLLNTDDNILQEAKNELNIRYNAQRSVIRDEGISAVINVQEDQNSKVISGVQEEITKRKEERQKYLEDLGA